MEFKAQLGELMQRQWLSFENHEKKTKKGGGRKNQRNNLNVKHQTTQYRNTDDGTTEKRWNEKNRRKRKELLKTSLGFETNSSITNYLRSIATYMSFQDRKLFFMDSKSRFDEFSDNMIHKFGYNNFYMTNINHMIFCGNMIQGLKEGMVIYLQNCYRVYSLYCVYNITRVNDNIIIQLIGDESTEYISCAIVIKNIKFTLSKFPINDNFNNKFSCEISEIYRLNDIVNDNDNNNIYYWPCIDGCAYWTKSAASSISYILPYSNDLGLNESFNYNNETIP